MNDSFTGAILILTGFLVGSQVGVIINHKEIKEQLTRIELELVCPNSHPVTINGELKDCTGKQSQGVANTWHPNLPSEISQKRKLASND